MTFVAIGALRFNCVQALCVLCLFLTVPWVGVWSVIVEFFLKNFSICVISA